MDLVVVLTDHSIFDYAMIAECSPPLFDTRNALKDFRRADLTFL